MIAELVFDEHGMMILEIALLSLVVIPMVFGGLAELGCWLDRRRELKRQANRLHRGW